MPTLNTIDTRVEDRVLYATLNTPPLNMIGPALVRDLITLVHYLETHADDVRVVVFDSASPDFFSAHVDMTQVSALRPELARLEPDASVVTSRLEVRGVHGLRVADASVMPTIIRGHTHAPSMVIGAKAADLIADANCSRLWGTR